MSQAKMRALKPEVDEINAKFPGQEKAMEKQQATMALYRKAGVNPMGGCLPMVLQMPILFAMFFFFPTSIELRGQSFLWAHDLSTYDSILSWNYTIPVIGNFMGNHLSLFTILMTITTIISTKAKSIGSYQPGNAGNEIHDVHNASNVLLPVEQLSIRFAVITISLQTLLLLARLT